MDNVTRLCGVAFLLAALVFTGCKKEEAERTPPVRPAKIITLTEPGLRRTLNYPAQVKAIREADLSFLVPGRIEDIFIRRGQEVKKDQKLAILDDRDYRNNFNAAQAVVNERKTFLDRTLQAKQKGVATALELEAAQRDYDVAKANAAVSQKQLDDAILKAPFDGEIAVQYREIAQDVASKEKVFHIQNLDQLKIIVDVPENIRQLFVEEGAAHLEAGGELFVVFEDLPKPNKFNVTFFEDEKAADPLTRTYALTFVMAPPKNVALLPGMSAAFFAKLKDWREKNDQAFYVPSEAVVAKNGQECYVWVQNPKTQEVHQQPVKVGQTVDNNIEVLDGLKTGQNVVVSGANYLEEGMKVRPLKFDTQRKNQ